MPRMDGLEALRIIMNKMPLPVLMVSSLTEDGAQATLDALDMGAIDYIPKNLDNVSLNIVKLRDELVEKIKTIVKKKSLSKITKAKRIVEPQFHIERPDDIKKEIYSKRGRIVAIGTSTGGPKALQDVLPLLPKDLPCGVLVVQHMPAAFTEPFASRLNQLSQIEVKQAEQNDLVRPGLVLLAPGDFHMKAIKKNPTEVTIELTKYPNNLLHRPSVDVMMKSVAQHFYGRSLGVIMTGMGHDGRDGMRVIKEREGRTIAQSEETCVVFGMPKAAIDINVVDKIVPLFHIAGEIINMV